MVAQIKHTRIPIPSREPPHPPPPVGHSPRRCLDHRRHYRTNFQIDPQLSNKDPLDQTDTKGAASQAATQPLAPPPRPAPTHTASDQVDYFSGSHTGNPGNNTHFSREPNPFEKSFGQPPSEAPDSKSLLPPVASLTSPAPLAPEGASTGGYNFASSLRSGPLSPAMLGGPVGSGTDYFGPQASTAFPGVTPNESSLRTGLTPGGGGSMFPAPSPGSQAFIQSLANGGATPSTIDFHRTAINAAQASKNKDFAGNEGSSQESKSIPASAMDPLLRQQPTQPQSFGQHDSDAANGLYLLAQATNDPQASQFPSQINTNGPPGRQVDTSPTMTGSMGRHGSLPESAQGSGDGSDGGEQGKMATRSRGKRASGGKGAGSSNGKRKAEDTAAKQTSAKKQKNGSISQDLGNYDSDDEQVNIKEEQYHNDGRKMTDEEKRKNFLERNRYDLMGSISEGRSQC